jgi:hypothetical protein
VARLPIPVFAAVVGLVLVTAALFVLAARKPSLEVTSLDVEVVGPRTAVVRWQTTEPARSFIAYGSSRDLGLWERGSAVPSRRHRAVLDGLAFDTPHRLEVVADAAGESATARGSFETPPVSRARLETKGRTLLLNGDPFFAIMQHRQCPQAVAQSLALGFTVFAGPCSQGAPHAVAVALEGRAVAVLPPGAGGAGSSLPDEPDDNGITPRELRAHLRAAPERPVFLTLTAGFVDGDDARYLRYVEVGDVVGFDLYPVNRCRRDRLHEVYEAQVRLQRLAGGKPTFQWIETGLIEPHYCDGVPPTPEEVRAQVFLALAGGARGIGYFTHTWSPDYDRLDLDPEVAAEIGRTNRQLEALAPAILSPRAPPATASDPNVYAFAREREGALYVFVVNAADRPVETTVRVPGLRGRPLQRFEEEPTVSARRDEFRDELPPLHARIYVAAPAGTL